MPAKGGKQRAARNIRGQIRKKFNTPTDLFEAAAQYFEACDDNMEQIVSAGKVHLISKPQPYGIAGLAAHLGMHRSTLVQNYSGSGQFAEQTDESGCSFDDVYQWIKSKCEGNSEQRLLSGNGPAAGHIFNLCNHYGWRDVRKVETHNVHELGPLAEADELEREITAALNEPFDPLKKRGSDAAE